MGSSSISNLLVEIFQVIQKTTVLSVESIIRAIDMAEPVAILKKTFMFVVPSRCGGVGVQLMRNSDIELLMTISCLNALMRIERV